MIYTATQDETLVEAEARAVRNGLTLLQVGFPVDTVEGYLSRMADRFPGAGLTRHACHGPHCTNLTDSPIVDEYAATWVREQALTFCSQDCLSNAAEGYWTGMWSA